MNVHISVLHYVFFNHGTHAITHCVRARLGVRVKRPMVVSALDVHHVFEVIR